MIIMAHNADSAPTQNANASFYMQYGQNSRSPLLCTQNTMRRLFKPSRMATTQFEEGEKDSIKDKKKKEKERAKAAKSSLVRQLREELSERPEEEVRAYIDCSIIRCLNYLHLYGSKIIETHVLCVKSHSSLHKHEAQCVL